MDLQKLKGFYWTAQLGSVTAAARRIHVSQSAVSRVFTPGASASKKTIEKVRKAADELGYPVVLKAEAPTLVHKTESNAVILNIAGDAALEAAQAAGGDIRAVLEQRRCDAVVLSGSARPARGLIDEQLPALIENVDIPVFVGGSISARHGDAIDATGAISIGQDFQSALTRIGEQLGSGKRR